MRSFVLSLVTSLLAAALLAPAALGQSEQPPLMALEVKGSPLVRDNADARLEVTSSLAEPAELRVRITDFNGRTVRELFVGTRAAGDLVRTWRGGDGKGSQLPSGPYRVVATASSGGRTERASEWITLADRKLYPRRPGFITVAVDPGHGGELSGAVGADGTREADLNLDIGLRLARMLEGAGVNVVITRTTDAFVNEPPEDRTGDGVIDETDELAARPDAANEARADLFISVHNNIAVNKSVDGPSTFFYDDRSFSSRSAQLARIIQEEMLGALRSVGNAGYEPYDHGALIYPYYVLRGYDAPRLRRPTQMPGVLSEGMFLSNPRELRYLKRPAVRSAMAVAYYNAIARYLGRRSSHAGYELIAGPEGPLPASEKTTISVEVRNHGTEDMRGWDILAETIARPSRYVSRFRKAKFAGKARVPRLGPGQAATIEVEVTAPDAGGEWMLLFDARDKGGERASRNGSPRLQVPLTTLAPPEPPASPSPEQTLEVASS